MAVMTQQLSDLFAFMNFILLQVLLLGVFLRFSCEMYTAGTWSVGIML